MEKKPPNPLVEELNQQAMYSLHKGLVSHAEELLRNALNASPEDFSTLSNLGCLYCENGQPAAAEPYLRRAVRTSPENELALNNLGHVLMLLNNASEAETLFQEACTKDPNSSLSRYNLATAQLKQERWEEANQQLSQVLASEPENAEATRGLGLVKMGQKQPDLAKAFFLKAIQLNPAYTEAWYDLGTAYMDLELWEEAQDALMRVLQSTPAHKDAGINLAQVLLAKNQLAESKGIMDELIRIHPEDWRCWFNLGQYLYKTFHFQEAVEAFETALDRDNTHWECFNALGITLHETGDFDKAQTTLRKALELCPSAADAHWNLSLTLLSKGSFSDGWKEYEWRWKRDSFPTKLPPTQTPRWNGERGSLCLYTEQGFGDNIQFVRFLQHAKKLCQGKVLLVAEGPLTRLFQDVKGVDEVIPKESGWQKVLATVDYQLPLMSLPFILKNDLLDHTFHTPYLKPNQSDREQWEGDFPKNNALKVGVTWEGNLQNQKGLKRSIPTDLFLEWLDNLNGIDTFYCLQPERSGKEIILKSGKTVKTFPKKPVNFAETAGFMEHMDIVISIDTANAHLAGALGKDLYLLLCAMPDWRWLNGNSPQLWYPNLKIYKQSTPGNWDSPLQLLQKGLEERLVSSNSHQ